MSEAARILAHAIRNGARRHTERQGRQTARATVLSVQPLRLDLHDSDLILDEDDVEFADHAITELTIEPDGMQVIGPGTLAVGDVVAVLEVSRGDWVIVKRVAR